MSKKLLLAIILYSLTAFSTFAAGKWGSYVVKGKVYVNCQILPNDTLLISFGKKDYRIITDSNGNYEFKVDWTSCCPSGKSRRRKKQCDRIMNPKKIVFNINNNKNTFKNKWRKYGSKDQNFDIKIKQATT